MTTESRVSLTAKVHGFVLSVLYTREVRTMTQQELARCLAYRINVGKENYKNHPDLYKHHHGPVTYHVNRKLSHKVKYV